MERERSVTVSHEHLRYLIARGSSRSADVRDLLAAGQTAVVSPMAPDTDLTPPRVRDSEALAVGPALRSCARMQGRRRCGRVAVKRDLCDHWHNLRPRVTDPCEADGDSPSPRLLSRACYHRERARLPDRGTRAADVGCLRRPRRAAQRRVSRPLVHLVRPRRRGFRNARRSTTRCTSSGCSNRRPRWCSMATSESRRPSSARQGAAQHTPTASSGSRASYGAPTFTSHHLSVRRPAVPPQDHRHARGRSWSKGSVSLLGRRVPPVARHLLTGVSCMRAPQATVGDRQTRCRRRRLPAGLGGRSTSRSPVTGPCGAVPGPDDSLHRTRGVRVLHASMSQPASVRYRSAKHHPTRRFHALYDKVARSDILWRAWVDVATNGGVPELMASRSTPSATGEHGRAAVAGRDSALCRRSRTTFAPVNRRDPVASCARSTISASSHSVQKGDDSRPCVS